MVIERSVLQVNTTDIGGGAAAIAFGLHRIYRERGVDAWMAVGNKRSGDPHVLEVPNEESRGVWARAWKSASELLTPMVGHVPGAYRARGAIRDIGNPARTIRRLAGRDDFDFPGTQQILDLPPEKPELLHLHNLHGDYFDLRALPALSRSVPTLITLHDSWMLGGNEPNPFRLEGSENHEITVSRSVPNDATASNWGQKKRIYSGTRLMVVTPSRWLADLAANSILADAAIRVVVINNGIDQRIFHPAPKREARNGLGISSDKVLVVFAANGIRNNGFKDYPTMRAAVGVLSRALGDKQFEFIGVGDDGPTENFTNGKISFVPHVDRPLMAQYYQAADAYIHAARSDNFPNTVIEALSCGTPVVATAVGGIPEQVRNYDGWAESDPAFGAVALDATTGILVGRAEGEKLGRAVAWLVTNGELLERMGRNAARDASVRFSAERQADEYLTLYSEMITQHTPSPSASFAS